MPYTAYIFFIEHVEGCACLDPEGDPGHHDYKTGGDVGVKHKVPEQHKQVNLLPNNLTL